MANKFQWINLLLLLFFFQNSIMGQVVCKKPVVNKSMISKTGLGPTNGGKFVGTYEMGDHLLWGAKLVLYPDYNFDYSYFDDISHISTKGKWSCYDSYLILNTDEQEKDFIQIEEYIDKQMNEGERKYQVLDDNGSHVAAEFDLNYQGCNIKSDKSGIIYGNIVEMDSFCISNCEISIFPGVHVLKNSNANMITIRYIKPYDFLFNKILTDEHWLFEDQKIYCYFEKGEINRTIFFHKKVETNENSPLNSNSTK